MKLISTSVVVLLILMTTTPDESEAGLPLAWFAAVAARVGVKLIKNSYYARCKTRYVPAGINCPRIVFGWGLSRNQAQNSAKAYASMMGDSQCARYVGHCQIAKLLKGRGK